MSYVPIEEKTGEHYYPRFYEPSQLHLEFLSVNGLNPYDAYDSSPRRQMWSSHIGQALVIAGATVRYQQTGFEREYGKYTFGTRMPVDAVVLRAIDRYPRSFGQDSIRLNPQKIVIYEEHGTNRIGVLDIQNYTSYHQYFGFENKMNPEAMALLYRDAPVPAGTVFAGSPLVDADGNYMPGIQLNMCLMTHPAISEDGVMARRGMLPSLAYKTYERRTVGFGAKEMPLNAFGTTDIYKIMADIGEYIRESGLVMATRSYNIELAPAEQSIFDLMEIDEHFDRTTYAIPGKGRVVDIIVHHDENSMKPCTPLGMDKQARKYDAARRQFYQSIMDEYNALKKSRGDKLKLTPQFHSLVKEAWSVVGKHEEVIQKLNRQQPMDDWSITFVIEYTNIPDIGSKITDGHGGKGVIVHIAEDHEMPVDANGVRADVVMDPLSIWGRMNPGRMFEMYVNAAGHDVRQRLGNELGIAPGDHQAEQKIAKIERENPSLFRKAMDYLIGYYERVVPLQAGWFKNGDYKLPLSYHMGKVIEEWPVLHYPPNNDAIAMDIVDALEADENYRPHYGPVSYVDYSGEVKVTRRNVRVASLYFILLEKTGDDWTSVSSGKVQHFGVLSQVSGIDKYATPTRQNPTRITGESEIRILEACVDGEVVADQMDRNNNPATHKHITEMLLEAVFPTNIEKIVDRTKIPFGGMKALKMIKHLLECAGMRFVAKPWTYAEKPENWEGLSAKAWRAAKAVAARLFGK